jgi:hypothetical protein
MLGSPSVIGSSGEQDAPAQETWVHPSVQLAFDHLVRPGDAAGNRVVHVRSPAPRRHHRRRRRHDERGQPEGHRDRRAVVHPRHTDSPRSLRGRPAAPRAPGQDIPDGHVFTQPWPTGPTATRRDQVIFYQHRHDRARRTLRGTAQQVGKARDRPLRRAQCGTHAPCAVLGLPRAPGGGLRQLVTFLSYCPVHRHATLTTCQAGPKIRCHGQKRVRNRHRRS